MTNVLIVDDERLVQELFAKYIDTASDRYTLIETTGDAANAELICERTPVNLILMDVCTANHSSGLAATERIKQRFPHIKVIIVTSAPEFRFIEKAHAAQADSFWYKDISDSELLDVMDRTMQGEKVYPDRTPEVDLGFSSSSEFTRKEMEVLLHLAEGKSNKRMAEALNITEDTIKYHIRHLMEKTGCTTRTQLAVLASKTKLVLPEY